MPHRGWVAVATLIVLLAACSDEPSDGESENGDSSAAASSTSDPATAASSTSGPSPDTILPPEGPPRVSDTDELEIVTGRVAGAGSTVDLYRTPDTAPTAAVVIFGDSRVSAAGYGPLAARLAAEGAAVGVADRRGDDGAPVASSCVIEATSRWAGESRSDGSTPSLVVVGFGDGAVPAIGEAFDDIWTSWTGGDRCPFEAATVPVALVVVAAQLGAVPESSFAESLDPFDQVGGNPYLQVRSVAGVDVAEIEDGRLVAFHEGLIAGGYDADLVEPDLDTNVLFGGGGIDGLTDAAADAVFAAVADTIVFTAGPG